MSHRVFDRVRPPSGTREHLLLGVGVGAWVLILALSGWAVFGIPQRPSYAEVELDHWAERQGRAISWRSCDDDSPLEDGMVQCEVGFHLGGRGVFIFCPGASSSETTCRWTR